MTGVLTEVRKEGVVLDMNRTSVTLAKEQLSLKSRLMCYQEDYATYKLEKAKELARRQRELEEREAAAAERRRVLAERRRLYAEEQQAQGKVLYKGQWMYPSQAQQLQQQANVESYMRLNYPQFGGAFDTASAAQAEANRRNARLQGQLDAGREAAMGGGVWVGPRVGRWTYTLDRNINRFVVYQE